MAEPNGYIQGSNGVLLELIDKTAREELPKKLTRPATAQVGDYLRIKAIGPDGTMEVEAVPAKVSALENDAGYTTEARVQELLAAFPTFEIEVVQELPATGEEKTIYLVPFADDSGSHLEYLYVNGAWEVIGSGKDSGENADYNSAFSGRKASFYGDSLTEVNWHYTKGYHEWVKEILGLASYDNYGKSGYKVSDVYNKVTATTDTPDIVFVMCGVNDQNFDIPLGTIADVTTGTTYGALNLLCAKLKEKYPVQIVVFITPHYQTKYPHSGGVTSYEVSKAIKDVCEQYAIPVYDSFTINGIYETNLAYFTTDNCHWNDFGHEMVGKNLASWMLAHFQYVYTKVTTTGIVLDTETLSFSEAGSKTLTATVTPDNSSEPVIWKSSNESVAVVSDGVVTALKSGTATITATSGSYSASCAVTVDIPTVYYSVTNSLSNCVTSNNAASIEENTAYSAIITSVDGYAVDSITVTMGGVDITATAVSGANITIASVTGNIVITATASESMEEGYRWLTADDIVSHAGADSVTVTKGTITPVNATMWTILKLDGSIREIKGVTNGTELNLAYYDKGDGSCTCGKIKQVSTKAEIYHMTGGQSALGSDKTPTYVLENNSKLVEGVECTITLNDDGVVVSIDGEPVVTAAEGNMIGVWTNNNITTWWLDNIKVKV